MSASSQTPTKNLPLFESDDKPTWLGDFNGAMTKIDQALSGGIASDVALQNRCTAIEAAITALTARVAALETGGA